MVVVVLVVAFLLFCGRYSEVAITHLGADGADGVVLDLLLCRLLTALVVAVFRCFFNCLLGGRGF